MSRLGKVATAAAATLALTVIPAARSSAAIPSPDPQACVLGDHWAKLTSTGTMMWFELVGEHFAVAGKHRYWHVVDDPKDNMYIGGFVVTCDLSNNLVGFADLSRDTSTPAGQPVCGHADFTSETQLSDGYAISSYHLVGERISWTLGIPPPPAQQTWRYVYWAVDETIYTSTLPGAFAALSDAARCPANAAGG